MPKNSKTPVTEATDVETAVAEALADAETMTIHQAAAVSGLSDFYIRKAVRQGKLATIRTATNDKGGFRHDILVSSFREWRETAGTKSAREDGRNKFVLYMSPEEVERFTEMVGGTEFAQTLKRANIKAVAAVVPDEA